MELVILVATKVNDNIILYIYMHLLNSSLFYLYYVDIGLYYVDTGLVEGKLNSLFEKQSETVGAFLVTFL